MPDLVPYEVFALRYATLPTQRRPQNFLGGDPHDGPMPLDYYVWLLCSEDRKILVDTGFDATTAEKRGRQHLRCPAEALRLLGVDAEDVEDVVITHLHYDHCGNFGLFPAATFHLQDREMAYATGRCMTHQALKAPFEVEDVVAMVRGVYDGRVAFHDCFASIAPGVELHRVGGHTDGLQIVRVWTRRGWVVLASDASHFYANMEEARSFPIVYNVGDMLEGFRTVYRLAESPDHVIPGHDPLVMTRYPAPDPGLEGVVVALHEEPIKAEPQS